MLKNGSTLVGLAHRERRWTLEVYELVAVDDAVYRPRRRRIEGRIAILGYLRRHDGRGSLSRVTERLMRRHAGVECAFDGVNGGWVLQGNQARFAVLPAAGEAEPAALSESASVR